MVCRAARPDQPAERLRYLFLQSAYHEPAHASARWSRAATCAPDLDVAGHGTAAWRFGATGACPGATSALGAVGDAVGAALRACDGESAGWTGVSAAVLSALCGLLGAGAIGRWTTLRPFDF